MIYLTGDTHGDFGRISHFCKINNTSKNDILIILGDAGINYYGEKKDIVNKKYIQSLPITLFCIHGNHENRVTNIPSYQLSYFGKFDNNVYVEEEYPNILFAIDGSVYTINKSKCLVMGGAYSVDKYYRISHAYNWWEDEQPSKEIKKYITKLVNSKGNSINYILSHTCPIRYEPNEWFIDGLQQETIDKSTEIWLDSLYDELPNVKKWYCGHYHGEKTIDNMRFMFENYCEFGE